MEKLSSTLIILKSHLDDADDETYTGVVGRDCVCVFESEVIAVPEGVRAVGVRAVGVFGAVDHGPINEDIVADCTKSFLRLEIS